MWLPFLLSAKDESRLQNHHNGMKNSNPIPKCIHFYHDE